MVSSRMLDQIHLRLQAIRRYELPFGNLMFLLEKVSNCDNLVQRLIMPTALCGLYQHLSFFLMKTCANIRIIHLHNY